MNRASIRVLSFTLAAIAVLAGFTWRFKCEAEANARQLQYHQERAALNLTESLTTIADTLEKERYCVSPALRVSMAAQIWREAGEAASALGELPLSDTTLDQVSRFIAQTGDYAYYLARKAAAGETVTAEEQQTVADLGRIARDCTLTLSMGRTVPDTLAAADVGLGLSEIEADFPDVPTLIYDGPLSDHLQRREPAMLSGLEAVSEAVARKQAASMMGIAADRLTLSGEGNGTVPVYSYTAEANGRRWYCDVAKAGGIVTDWAEMRDTITENITVAEAVRRAELYLHEHGIRNMSKTYYLDENGIVLVNFAALQDDVVLYPDLIKIGVARDDGAVVRFEATGYVMCHRTRELPEVQVSADEAASILDVTLTVESTRLALVPTDGEREVLCHEFHCRDAEGTEILIYCDVETGAQTEILVLIENENGTLTI